MWTPSLNRLSGRLFCSAFALLLSACAEREEPYVTPDWDLRVGEDCFVEVRAHPSPAGPKVAVRAERATGEGTRSHLAPDGLAVHWTVGDGFRAEFLRDGEYYYADFETDEGGETTAVFTTESLVDGQEYVCVYPGYRRSFTSKYDGTRLYDLTLPSMQDPVAGSFSPGTNLAMAYSPNMHEGTGLLFYNLPALLKFRMAGALVNGIREIRFSAPTSIAGGGTFHIGDDGYPTLCSYRVKQDNHESPPSNTVTLTGVFEPGQDYYIALWPKEVAGFEMTFSDGEGNYTTLRSSKTIQFRRSVITDFGTIALGDEFTGAKPVSMDPELYRRASAGTKPVTVAVVPEGFQEHELPQYERLARSAIDKLLDTEPYRSYADRFNVYILKAASAESGASVTDGNGNVIQPVNSYFGVRWGADSYGDMRADDNTVFNFVSGNCPDIQSGIHPIDEVPVIILVNDSRYAGRTWCWNTGRSYCMIPFTYSGGNICWIYPKDTPSSETDPSGGCHETTPEEYAVVGRYSPGDWRNTVVHEFGHSFARLMDEYWSDPTTANATQIRQQQTWPVPFGLNISANYANPPWQEFLDRREALMAQDERYGRIGTFQGGATYMYGAWRCERVSGMMDNRQYFSAWDRYLIVKRIMTLSGDLASFSFDSWLAKDVTIDPVRDLPTRSDWALDPALSPYDFERAMRSMGVTPVGPPAPPGFVEE